MQPHALSLRGSQSSPSPPRTDGRGSLSDPGGSEVDMMIQAAFTSTSSGGVRWPAPEEISALGDPGSTSRDEDSLLSRQAAFANTDGSCGEENLTLAERERRLITCSPTGSEDGLLIASRPGACWGECHFYLMSAFIEGYMQRRGTPLGHTAFKRRYIAASGWKLVSLSLQEWEDLQGEFEQLEYLRRILDIEAE